MEIIFRLEGAIVPKARPRVVDRRAFMPQNYTDWKDRAIDSLRTQHIGEAIAVPVSLDVVLIGKHSRKCDGDNTIGSLADALVQSGILADDNMLRVPSESIRLFYSKQAAIALIKLSELMENNLPEWALRYDDNLQQNKKNSSSLR